MKVPRITAFCMVLMWGDHPVLEVCLSFIWGIHFRSCPSLIKLSIFIFEESNPEQQVTSIFPFIFFCAFKRISPLTIVLIRQIIHLIFCICFVHLFLEFGLEFRKEGILPQTFHHLFSSDSLIRIYFWALFHRSIRVYLKHKFWFLISFFSLQKFLYLIWVCYCLEWGPGIFHHIVHDCLQFLHLFFCFALIDDMLPHLILQYSPDLCEVEIGKFDMGFFQSNFCIDDEFVHQDYRIFGCLATAMSLEFCFVLLSILIVNYFFHLFGKLKKIIF